MLGVKLPTDMLPSLYFIMRYIINSHPLIDQMKPGIHVSDNDHEHEKETAEGNDGT